MNSAGWTCIALIAVLLMLVTWGASTFDFTVYKDLWFRFQNQTRSRKIQIILVLTATILYAGTKPSSQSSIPAPSPSQIITVPQTEIQSQVDSSSLVGGTDESEEETQEQSQSATSSCTNNFAITDFEVDVANQEVGFALQWDTDYLSSLNSQYIDLFMATNLISNDWLYLDDYYLSSSTNYYELVLGSNDFSGDARISFTNALSTSTHAFFVFGLDIDGDNDYLTDAYEKYVTKTSQTSFDTDRDGLKDGYEENKGTNPHFADSDGDGLLDGEEVNKYGTSPLLIDSDGDQLLDFEEGCDYYNYNWSYWQEGILLTNLFNSSAGDIDGAIARLSLPSPVVIAGEAYTNVFVDVNGLVYLSSTNNVTESLNTPQYISNQTWNKADIALVPLWTDLILRASLDSQILLKKTDLDEYIIEYLNVGINDENYTTNTFSGQVILSPNATNRIIMTYRNFNNDYLYAVSKRGYSGVRVDNNFYDGNKYRQIGPVDGDSTYIFRLGYETRGSTDDSDGDRLTDYEEIHTYGTSPSSYTDTDGDGLSDGEELKEYGTNRLLADTDADGVDDRKEINSGEFDPLVDESELDADGDGLSDLDEYFEYDTDRYVSDTDDDWLSDYEEVTVHNTNPKSQDSDNDGLLDYEEVWTYATSPLEPDTDDDSLSDKWEVQYNLNPKSEEGENGSSGDPDGDGLINARECTLGTNPILIDTDGDGLSDALEVGHYNRSTNVIPFDCSLGVNLLANLTSDQDDGEFNVGLPFPVNRFGIEATNMVVNVNGTVQIVKKDKEPYSLGYVNDNFSSASYNNYISIAAYWDDLMAYIEQAPQIFVADITTNDMCYCVIEYKNIGIRGKGATDANKATFQIVIPQNETESIFVQYLNLGTEFSGASATVGCHFGELATILVSHNKTGHIASGDVISYFGLGTSPAASDTDVDGLTDAFELSSGSSPFINDTDGDGLIDGWEYEHGLNPLSSTGLNGADGDLDGDGFSNKQEYLNATNPGNDDTDGDGLTDLKELGGVISSTFPWLEFSSETDITGLFSSMNNACVKVPLSTPLLVEDVSITNLTVDINGLVYLHKPNYAGTISSRNSLYDLKSTSLNSNTIVLAPFWNDMEIVTNNPASKISVGLASLETNQYYLVEFSNLKTSASPSSVTNRISFQVAIPYGGTDRVYVRYVTLEGATDSEYASVGIQDFGGQQRHSYCYKESGLLHSGLSLAFVLGLDTSPSATDTDGDKISDFDELLNNTNPRQPDTDGDGLYDGRELSVGFSPVVNNETDADLANNTNADPDGDGLTNKEECEWNTNPFVPDTDGDGVSDSTEISQNSDPADAADEGIAGSRALVSFTFGDPSGSHSEKYRLNLSPVYPVGMVNPPRSHEWVNATYGECETVSAMLECGVHYQLTMEHAGTNEEDEPDFDYQLIVIPKPGAGVLIDDPEGLIVDSDMTSSRFTGAGKTAIIKVVDAALCADYNRDGAIDDSDKQALKSGRILRHWVNDDKDEGDIAEEGSDNLEQAWLSANYQNSKIDGRCDLLDFTPIHLDIHNLLSELGNYSNLTFKLVHENSAVNVAWSSLLKSNANLFLTQDETGYGPSFNKSAHESSVVEVESNGVNVPKAFISQIANSEGKGVLLLEGTATTTRPLRLEIYAEDNLCFISEMPLSISSIENMYRKVSLRNFTCPSSIPTPTNNPDIDGAKNVVFLHGFNVNEEKARGWHAEMFKRLWQSGANMKFWGVTWNGNGGEVTKSYYHTNVQNALTTADSLKTLVNTMVGSNTVVMAHSLGNMVVSRAIQKGMNVEKYFMLNAAIASEAFNGTLQNTSSTNTNFVPQAWREYPSETWSARWHELFASDPADDRNELKWKNQFTDILTKTTVYNYYSSGDEVFELSKGVPGMLTGAMHLDWPVIDTQFPYLHFGDVFSLTIARHSWQKQECLKGINFVAGTTTAGWAFQCDKSGLIGGGERCYSPAAATNLVVNGVVALNAVFKRKPDEMFQPSIAQSKQDEIIAFAIPALSPAVGSVLIDNCSNVDVNEESDSPNSLRINSWGRSDPAYGDRWLHSDIKDMAYYYVYKLFLDIRAKGGF